MVAMAKVVVRSEAPGLGPVMGSGGMLFDFIQNNDEMKKHIAEVPLDASCGEGSTGLS
jgi:hypothetical protein